MQVLVDFDVQQAQLASIRQLALAAAAALASERCCVAEAVSGNTAGQQGVHTSSAAACQLHQVPCVPQRQKPTPYLQGRRCQAWQSRAGRIAAGQRGVALLGAQALQAALLLLVLCLGRSPARLKCPLVLLLQVVLLQALQAQSLRTSSCAWGGLQETLRKMTGICCMLRAAFGLPARHKARARVRCCSTKAE